MTGSELPKRRDERKEGRGRRGKGMWSGEGGWFWWNKIWRRLSNEDILEWTRTIVGVLKVSKWCGITNVRLQSMPKECNRIMQMRSQREKMKRADKKDCAKRIEQSERSQRDWWILNDLEKVEYDRSWSLWFEPTGRPAEETVTMVRLMDERKVQTKQRRKRKEFGGRRPMYKQKSVKGQTRERERKRARKDRKEGRKEKRKEEKTKAN